MTLNSAQNQTIEKILTLLKSPNISIVQLVTIESYLTISKLLNLKYSFASQLNDNANGPILFIVDDDCKVPLSRKVILYSRKMDTDYIKVSLVLTEDEKMRWALHRNFPKPLLRDYKVAQIQSYGKQLGDYGVSYEEFIVLVVVRNNRRFEVICAESRKTDDCFANCTKVLMTLNSLVDKGFLKKIRKTYKIAIDNENLKIICDKHGYTL